VVGPQAFGPRLHLLIVDQAASVDIGKGLKRSPVPNFDHMRTCGVNLGGEALLLIGLGPHVCRGCLVAVSAIGVHAGNIGKGGACRQLCVRSLCLLRRGG
jgi:hypothetical protein